MMMMMIFKASARGTLWPEKEGNLKLRNGLETRQSAIHHSLPHHRHHHPNHHTPIYILKEQHNWNLMIGNISSRKRQWYRNLVILKLWKPPKIVSDVSSPCPNMCSLSSWCHCHRSRRAGERILLDCDDDDHVDGDDDGDVFIPKHVFPVIVP